MKIKCEWCNSWINDFDQVCPNCNGINNHYKRQSTGVPQTIQELKEWAAAKNLPLASMRTYIGEDFRGAKAYGIYRDEATGTFIVYKNKADGTRSIRYQGPDEAYAVNELYLKMKERVSVQKSHSSHSHRKEAARKRSRKRGHTFLRLYLTGIYLFMAVLFLNLLFILLRDTPTTGYYSYENQSYYYYSGDWYWWQDDSWTTAPVSSWMKDDYESYFESYSYSSDAEYDNFYDSGYYKEPSNSKSDDDSWDSDWDDSWDSNDSWDDSWDDWDSDW